MRILSVHNRYQIRGGEDESREAEEKLLQQKGHGVETYEENNDRIADLGAISTAIKTVWSTEAYNTLRHRLKEQVYDLVHVQNFFPLISPSVHYAAKAEGVPVIQTLRNYRLLCPNGFFFRDDRVCEDCLGKFVPWPAVLHSCYRDSRAASGVLATMLTTHRILPTWNQMVDKYITLSEFARDKFVQAGFPQEKIAVKPNFVDPDPSIGEGKGGYALYVGRLSPEKGISTLLSAWQKLGKRVPLKIVGEGLLAPQVAAAVSLDPAIEWLGRKPLPEVYELIGNATFLVFPTIGYETFGRVAIEAFAKGTPVIASQVGAIAELVESDRNGLHFRPGDAEDLAIKIDWALTHPQEIAQMRQEARKEFETKYTAEENYRRIMEIYATVRSK
ncbi:MAG: glycosyltransferase family 4 protein [Chroococcus sp. CMT-3BRIN-NPC107]|jgi:glycosyltransferase involved in cell wall biosynthesis|nr:glycosyltransferase family 4 protein [Chroococcus sp. CMT-3BRIN-NPC107]